MNKIIGNLKEKPMLWMTLALVLTGPLVLAFGMQQMKSGIATGKIVFVGPPPANFARIQEAINSDTVSDGDTIEVMWNQSTPYLENVTVSKRLTITRWSGDALGSYPIVDGGNKRGAVFKITVDGVNITGLIVQNGQYGILLESSNNIITNNTITSNAYGIDISRESANNTLRLNKMSGNSQNFWVDDYGPIDHFIQYINESNTVDGKPIVYWVNKEGKIPPYAGYVAIVNSTSVTAENLSSLQGVLVAYSSQVIVMDSECSPSYGVSFNNVYNSTVKNVTISDSQGGISLYGSENNVLQNNTIARMYGSPQGEGIYLRSSDNNSVLDNEIMGGTVYGGSMLDGVELSDSLNNTICGNTISGTSLYGIILGGSNGTVIFHNNFLNNATPIGICDSVDNVFDNGYEGNYWSDYKGKYSEAMELNGTGIWDTPYNLTDNHANVYRDTCPLVEKWSAQRTIDVTWYENVTITPAYYYIDILCDHVVASYRLEPNRTEDTGSITFNITAASPGYCNVTIPRNRIDGPFDLLIDGNSTPHYFIADANYSYFSFSYTEGYHMIKIVGHRLGYMFGDLNGDGVINMKDIAIEVAKFNEKWQNLYP